MQQPAASCTCPCPHFV